jgi:hypothetical protein
MTDMKRMSRPTTRADVAWILTCFFCGCLVAFLAALSQFAESRPHYGVKYTFVTSNGQTIATKQEPVLEQLYSKRVEIETNGDVQKIMIAAHEADPTSFIQPFPNHPKLKAWDYVALFFGGVLAMMMLSYFFRIIEKIFRRLLGVDVSAVK